MSAKVDSLTDEALQLPEDQRLTLAHRILASTEPQQRPEISSWWQTELARRIQLIDEGATERIPASEVLQEIDEQIGS